MGSRDGPRVGTGCCSGLGPAEQRKVQLYKLTQLTLVLLACRDQSRLPRPGVEDPPLEEHAVLGASFVSNDSGALRRLLDPQLIVQPPLPDSARQGAAAVEYLLGLAAETSVSESRLEPHMAVPEGPFVFEQGAWVLRNGNVLLRAPYSLRWRATAQGWRVVLWRWGAFR